ncbi:MAG: hypothetical protein J0M28_09280 [Thauera sp.]|nr:hypothetical protein [Thauera sp.]
MKHPAAHATADDEPVYSMDEYARQLGLTVGETAAIIERIRLEIDGPLRPEQGAEPGSASVPPESSGQP